MFGRIVGLLGLFMVFIHFLNSNLSSSSLPDAEAAAGAAAGEAAAEAL